MQNEQPINDMLKYEHVKYYKTNYRYNSLQKLNEKKSMHGVKRVVLFCVMTAILPAVLIILPLHLKHNVFKDVIYSVAESDILEIRDGINTIFCQQHSLKMNSSFNAFQLNHAPKHSTNRKHIRLKKSMTLPDDTLEYWGFYLLKGATVALKVCSRFDGSRILVVKGDRNLKTCGLMEHNTNKVGAHFNSEHAQVQVTFETKAEIVESDEFNFETGRNFHQQTVLTTTPSVVSEDVLDAQENHGGEDLTPEFHSTADQDLQDLKKKHTNYLKTHKTLKNASDGKKHVADKNNNLLDRGWDSGNFLKTDSNIDLSDQTTLRETDSKLNEEDFYSSTVQPHHKRHQKHENRKKKVHEATSEGVTADKPVNLQNVHNHPRSDARGHKIHLDQEFQEQRVKRDTILDRAINHGGNAINYKENASSSISSFENSLLECYDGEILLAKSFPPSKLCNNVKHLEQGQHMVSTHEVVSDGYYYYIFYSDNDFVQNDIHAVFDIYKPTYLYSNISETKGCINTTDCSFPIQFLSDEVVIVEVPTRDGIEHEDDDITNLVSTCSPRMAVYVIFPIAVLFFILCCAFI